MITSEGVEDTALEKLLKADKSPVDEDVPKPKAVRDLRSGYARFDFHPRLLETRSRSASAPPQRKPEPEANAEDIWGATGYVVLSSVAAAIGGLLFGYDVGIVSGAILQLRRPDVFNLSCLLQELVVSSMLLGAVLGSLCGGFMVDRFGRKVTIIFNAVVFILGAITLAAAPNYSLLIVGRVIVGFGVSVSAIGECIYISEIAPPTKRGLLVSLNELGITLGVLLAYLVNYIFIDRNDGWRYMFGLSIIPAAVQGVAMLCLPKSPRYLMLAQKEAEAEKILQKIRRKQDVSIELTTIRLSILSEKNRTLCELFGKKFNMRGRMLIGAGLVFFQQATGQPNVLYYAPTIFKAVGFHSDTAATLATVGVGAVKVIATVISLMLVDKVGRRKLLVTGASVMALATLTLGVLTDIDPDTAMLNPCRDLNTSASDNTTSLHLTQPYNLTHPLTGGSWPSPHSSYLDLSTTGLTPHSSSDLSLWSEVINSSFANSTSPNLHPNPTPSEMPMAARYASLAALMLFCGAYGLSFGPVTWLVLSEIYPAAVKGRAIALATVLNWGTNLVVSLTFLNLMDLLSVGGTFLMYSGICCASVLFILIFLLETKGRSLEQISEDMKNSSPGNKVRLAWQKIQCCGGHKSNLEVPAGEYIQVPLTDMDTGIT
ncbi:solute carrier family 2, facilitated glucose transporter member 12-like isoform X2 [Liolophura sinensis]|uniref:solute carrier family 2, facilitated glucose transporter member 12-like isoform X2 n=1 Tax=Liolophura sinensis TaxID=3198878 RepID=UPI0031591C69